jgi:hypothetical protein
MSMSFGQFRNTAKLSTFSTVSVVSGRHGHFAPFRFYRQ